MQPCVKSVQNYLTLKQNRKPLIVSIFLGILDNVLKSHIRSQNYEDFVILENILEIDLNFNTGIAFGLLKGRAEFTFLLSSLVLIWLIFQFKNTFANKIEEYAFMFVLGGALGNLGERFVNLLNGNNGKVTDFIELLFIPSFNLADSFIGDATNLGVLNGLIEFNSISSNPWSKNDTSLPPALVPDTVLVLADIAVCPGVIKLILG